MLAGRGVACHRSEARSSPNPCVCSDTKVALVINGYHHVTLNGVNYRLAEDAEGEHYKQRRAPLRLQTATVVQGVAGKFQLRPDLLEWQLTDWSGGEGALIYDSDTTDRYFESHNVDPLTDPGKLQLAKGYETTLDSAGVAQTLSLFLTKGRALLHGFDVDNDEVYVWTDATARWGVGVTNSEAGFGTVWEESTPCGDQTKVFP